MDAICFKNDVLESHFIQIKAANSTTSAANVASGAAASRRGVATKRVRNAK